MLPEEYITDLILNLGEVQISELRRVIRATNDSFPRGNFTTPEAQGWIAQNQEFIVSSILRVVDLNDEAIASLFNLGVLRFQSKFGEAVRITFSEVASLSQDLYAPGETLDIPNEQAIAITDLTATSAALYELFVEIASIEHSIGFPPRPPAVSVQSGSVQYTFGGGMLASGIALVVACGGGLVATPFGFVGGGVLASAGLIDLALGWRKAISENRKLKAESLKLEAEAHKLGAEARKIEAEVTNMETQLHSSDKYVYRSFAHSKLVPRDIVLREAERLGLKEGHANHVLNRALPKYELIAQRFRTIAAEKIWLPRKED